MEIPPNQTLYVNNLNEKLPKDELRRSLYALFGQFGPVLDVVALKTTRMRGQAFIVFRVRFAVWVPKLIRDSTLLDTAFASPETLSPSFGFGLSSHVRCGIPCLCWLTVFGCVG